MTELKLNAQIELPEGITLTREPRTITVKGPKGEVTRKLADKSVSVEVKGNVVDIGYDFDSKSYKKNLFTIRAHIKNMIKGVSEGYEYKLKICSGHFPMNVSLKGDLFEVKNFIGEKVPRQLKLKQGVDVKINGDIIEVKSSDKEIAGQTAASIEKLTKRLGFDKRIFQDGIYIIEKDGKVL